MALKICQFVANYSLSGIPLNRAVAPQGPNSNLIIPLGKNVIIKKISVDCIYNQGGDLLVFDYQLGFFFIDFKGDIIRPNHVNIINRPSTGGFDLNNIGLSINKYNPVQNYFVKAGGIRITNYFDRFNKIVLSNTTSAILSNISFLISIYYVDK